MPKPKATAPKTTARGVAAAVAPDRSRSKVVKKEEELRGVLAAIPELSRKIQADFPKYRRRVDVVRNFVTDEGLAEWAFGKIIGRSGTPHEDGSGARGRLERLGFVNVLKQSDESLKHEAVTSLKQWLEPLGVPNLIQRLDRFLLGKLKYDLRILVPPSALDPDRRHAEVRRRANAEAFDEGARNEVVREVAHRDRGLAAQGRAFHGTECAVCNFSFGAAYGAHGEGFIEMHHLHPIAGGTRESTVDDLRPVCANCHRMLHRGGRMLTIDELKAIIDEARRAQGPEVGRLGA